MQVISRIAEKTVAMLIAAMQCLSLIGDAAVRRFPALSPRAGEGRSRGDVPGWVLITLMSAILVAGLLAIAAPALERLFNEAMDQVQPGG